MTPQSHHAPDGLSDTKPGVFVGHFGLQSDDDSVERIGYFEEKGPQFGHVIRGFLFTHNP